MDNWGGTSNFRKELFLSLIFFIFFFLALKIYW